MADETGFRTISSVELHGGMDILGLGLDMVPISGIMIHKTNVISVNKFYLMMGV
jgi:hypothetical protein